MVGSPPDEKGKLKEHERRMPKFVHKPQTKRVISPLFFSPTLERTFGVGGVLFDEHLGNHRFEDLLDNPFPSGVADAARLQDGLDHLLNSFSFPFSGLGTR
jgi:hypothetical protein